MDAKIKEELHDLLVQADAILKVCYYSDVPDDEENAVQACAMKAASRLLSLAMEHTA